MSGQAGAARCERYYAIEFLSGIYENIAVPPCERENSDYIGRIFRKESVPYERALETIIPALNEYFQSLAGRDDIPLVPYADGGRWVDGTVIEDAGGADKPGDGRDEATTGLKDFTVGLMYVRIRADTRIFFADYATVDIALKGKVRRTALNGIADKVRELLQHAGKRQEV